MPLLKPTTWNRYTPDDISPGQTQFQYTFEDTDDYRSDIIVERIAPEGSTYDELTVDVHYTLDRDTKTVTLLTAATGTEYINIRRATDRLREIDHDPASTITGAVLNKDEKQSFRVKQEIESRADEALNLNDLKDQFNARGLSICNLGVADADKANVAVTREEVISIITELQIVTVNAPDVYYFEGDGIEVDFTLPGMRDTEARHWWVYKNGHRQYPTDSTGDDGVYSITTATGIDDKLTFDTPPEDGTVIMACALTGNVLAAIRDDTIGTDAIQDAAVTLAKMNFGVGAADRMLFAGALGVGAMRTLVAADVSDFTAAVVAHRLDQMATPTADLALGANKLTGVKDGTDAQDAVTKTQLDGAVNDLLQVQSGTPNLSALVVADDQIRINLDFRPDLFILSARWKTTPEQHHDSWTYVRVGANIGQRELSGGIGGAGSVVAPTMRIDTDGVNDHWVDLTLRNVGDLQAFTEGGFIAMKHA